MTKKMCISYKEYGEYLNKFTDMLSQHVESPESLTGVYGPPRGGLPIATHISHYFNTNLIIDLMSYKNERSSILIVDDVCDSGNTFWYTNYLLKNMPNVHAIFSAMFIKPRSFGTLDLNEKYIDIIDDDVWIVFPWEKDETPDKDYMEK